MAFGLGLTLSSGQPLTALAANAVYDSPGEIPETPRGEGIQTADGFKRRTPFESEVNVHLDYSLPLAGQRLTLLADAFNLFNTRRALRYDDWTEVSFAVPNPDFGNVIVYQQPFTMRIGARFEF